MSWPREQWVRAFPDYEKGLQGLPDLLDRDAVRSACIRAAVDPIEAMAAFVAVMAWGYGIVGYGRYRTRRVCSATPDAGQRLLDVAQTVRDDGAVSAYQRFAQDCRLPGLGPAFGTKFLYFVQPQGQAVTALILDRFVARWISRKTEVPLDPVPWSLSTYQAYLHQMHEWARELGCRADDLEELIFEAAVGEGLVSGHQE